MSGQKVTHNASGRTGVAVEFRRRWGVEAVKVAFDGAETRWVPRAVLTFSEDTKEKCR